MAPIRFWNLAPKRRLRTSLEFGIPLRTRADPSLTMFGRILSPCLLMEFCRIYDIEMLEETRKAGLLQPSLRNVLQTYSC